MSRHGTLVFSADELVALRGGALAELLQGAARAGIDEIIVEVDEVPAGLAELCAGYGLRLLVGVTCFHEHGALTVQREPDVRPVGADGSLRPRLEWYVGVVPTVGRVRREIVDRALSLALQPGVAGVVLDFIRWPLHWELECRPGAAVERVDSFDQATRTAFRGWAGRDLVPDPEAPMGVGADLRDDWIAFRCEVITSLVREVAELLHGLGRTVGAFVVPIDDERRRQLVGQDVGAWPVDAVYPMAYHAILKREPAWVGEVARELLGSDACGTEGALVVPVVQVTSEEEWARGADWGAPLTGSAFGDALRAAWAHVDRVAMFPGSAVIGDRIAVVGQLLRHANGA